MRVFFHGWRRKAGCMGLALACALMAGQLRSHVYSDMIRVRVVQGKEISLWSGQNSLSAVYRCATKTEGTVPPKPIIRWTAETVRMTDSSWESQRPSWSEFEWSGGDDRYNEEGWGKTLVVPYAVLSLPLTLLSACLILCGHKRQSEGSWRRKVGCVTLATVFPMTFIWIGSEFGGHRIEFLVNASHHVFTSTQGQLTWKWYAWKDARRIEVFWDAYPAHIDPPDPLEHSDIYRRWRWYRFDFGEGNFFGRYPMAILSIPYWGIVLPVTLLSTYLILWPDKRRQLPRPV